MSNVLDAYLAYKFIRNLVSPFDKWDAFQTGVIDKDGNIIVDRKSRSSEQKNSFGYFETVTLNLKKLLAKIPGGKSAIATYAAAILLIKEQYSLNESYIEDDESYLANALYAEMTILENALLAEETNVGGGAMAGVSPGQEPPCNKTKYRKENEAVSAEMKNKLRRILSTQNIEAPSK